MPLTIRSVPGWPEPPPVYVNRRLLLVMRVEMRPVLELVLPLALLEGVDSWDEDSRFWSCELASSMTILVLSSDGRLFFLLQPPLSFLLRLRSLAS